MSGFKFARVGHFLGASCLGAPVLCAMALSAVLLPAVSGIAQATPVVTYSPTGLPAAGGPINSIDMTGDLGLTSFTANSGANAVSVSMQGGAVVQGSVANQYAAPVTGGTAQNPTFLATPYFSTGGAPNTITLSFASDQSYLGLLWGSIGTGDYINLMEGSTLVASITGTQAMQAAAGYNGSSGAQGFGGSQYTLINLMGQHFNTAVLGQAGGPSFESGLFEYSAQNVAVPEPASLAMIGVGLAAIGLLRRRAHVQHRQ